MKKICRLFSLGMLALLLSCDSGGESREQTSENHNFERENLVAWCIVPFDAKKRTPTERAAMLREMGLTRSAYDWRKEHVDSFEEEILAYRQENIEFFAFWAGHPNAFSLFQKHGLSPQIWKTLSDPGNNGASPEERVQQAAESLVPLAKDAAKIGSQLGLYNHGGWGGEPVNLVAVCEKLHELGHKNVGIVYNFHHGHSHIQEWEKHFSLMQKHLLCLNLNGMNENAQPKILGIGKGLHEEAMIDIIRKCGYLGPIGILDHRNELDARESLLENIEGLEKLIAQK